MAQTEKERRDWIEQATSAWAAEGASIAKAWEVTVAQDFTRQGGDPEDRDALREWMEECRPQMLALIAERRREWFCEDVPLSVGATGEEVRKQMGREMTYRFRVTELTTNRVTFDATGGGTSFGGTWSVVRVDDASSRLTITYRLAMGGVMRLFEPLMRGGVRKQMEQAGQSINALLVPGDRGAQGDTMSGS